MTPSIQPNCFCPSFSAKVPAITVQKVHHGAQLEGGLTVREKKYNVARDAYRAIGLLGIGWKIPKDIYSFKCEDGSFVDVHSLKPKNVLHYLMNSQPEVVLGHLGEASLKPFWTAYHGLHPTHEVFSTHQDWGAVIPLAIHGDEGRGKRRSSTTVVASEAVLGFKNMDKICSICHPRHLDVSNPTFDETLGLAKRLTCKLEGHSFLQHWPLFVLAGTMVKVYKELTHQMVEIISEDLRELFHHGIQVGQKRYFIALVGAKGDLKWHSKIGKFTRGFEHQGRVVDKCCCHVCLAGTSDLPAEDLGAEPSWVRTIYEERPWGEADDEQPSLIRIPYDMSRPEAMYKHDILHTLRLGVFRDYTGSTVFLLLRWNYFGDSGTVNTKLEAAHGHFKLWLAANGKSAALSSFTKQLLQYKNKKSFPWFNVKASDCNLIMKWIATLLVGILNEQPPSWQVPVLQALLATCQCGLSFYGGVCNHAMFVPLLCLNKDSPF